MYTSSTSFSKIAAFSPKMASLLWYLTEVLNLLGLFDRSLSLTTKFILMEISENIEEDETLSQIRLDVTNTKIKTIAKCVIKNRRRLICLTNQLKILLRGANKVLSGCLSSTPIPLLRIKTQLLLLLLKITLKHQALSCFERALWLLHNHLISAPLAEKQ